MRIIVELEDGDRFMLPVTHNQALASIFKRIKEQQYLEMDTEFVMFTAPPLNVITDETMLCAETDSVHYFYQMETYNQLSRKLEIEAINSNKKNSHCVSETTQQYTQASTQQNAQKAGKTILQNQQIYTEWDDELMDIFNIPNAANSQELLESLAAVGTKVGFKMKVGLDITDKVMNQEQLKDSQFVKIDCAFPIRQCPFYLLYQIYDAKCLVFACNLNHSHEMGPIPLQTMVAQ